MEDASTILLFMPFYTQANTLHLLFLSLFIWKIEIILEGVMPIGGLETHLQGLSPLLSKRSQPVPLVTDFLAAVINIHSIVIVQFTIRRENEE